MGAVDDAYRLFSRSLELYEAAFPHGQCADEDFAKTIFYFSVFLESHWYEDWTDAAAKRLVAVIQNSTSEQMEAKQLRFALGRLASMRSNQGEITEACMLQGQVIKTLDDMVTRNREFLGDLHIAYHQMGY